ncbi:MAG TPA: hypothetical protein PLX20_11445 [Rhodocyclaceae bacterium]|nr:hypothetical protein [Rhodocyclaceae bacterium]HNH13744.1 hypothetical protein [Rhodocyclaceae bacterium]HNH98394.1 hypothetical protein [Rhodocyclaceae bacterium]
MINNSEKCRPICIFWPARRASEAQTQSEIEGDTDDRPGRDAPGSVEGRTEKDAAVYGCEDGFALKPEAEQVKIGWHSGS